VPDLPGHLQCPFCTSYDVTRLYLKNPLNPFSHTTYGKSVAAAAELFERSTRRYGKPDWSIDSVMVGLFSWYLVAERSVAARAAAKPSRLSV